MRNRNSGTTRTGTPPFRTFLQHYEVIEGLYNDKTYEERHNLCYATSKSVGDGWMSIGDASFFTDPIISPGMKLRCGHGLLRPCRPRPQALDEKRLYGARPAGPYGPL